MILAIKNAIPDSDQAMPAGPSGGHGTPEGSGTVADRIVRRSLAKREGEYADEVRRLLDAALEVMHRRGTSSRPRVADIVAAAGLSNDAFYRHFRSKDDLVNALLEDGAERLRSYLAHQMAKAKSPQAQVRRWVEGVLAQADGDVAAATLAVLWNGSSADGGLAAGRHFASSPLASLLREPFAALGSDTPDLHAALAAHAALGLLSDCLWRGAAPTRGESDRVVDFCLRAVSR
jgi:AcrR family transcriptional regulator